MSMVLDVTGVGKAYKNYGHEWRRVLSWFGLPFAPRAQTWVLQNVDFSIHSGESVGIIGQNGAGKSTLLKIITGTLKPTQGGVVAHGRIAAILELGMGFHPDLTGRQNAYHSAGLMGFSRSQIDAVIDDIEDFAEVGEYFDQPVRTYSSGMQVRVTFAVATAIRPEILIVDEALSVGDAYFQHKSFNRIREFQAQGTTLLIVSHDRNAVQGLCNRVILLEKGRVIKDGDPEAVMDFYNALIAEQENSKAIQQVQLANGKTQTISGTGEATVEEIGLYNEAGERLEFVKVGEPVVLKATVRLHADIPELVLGYLIKDRLGQPVFGTNTYYLDQKVADGRAGETVSYAFRFPMNLGVGSYSVTVALHSANDHVAANYEWKDLALVFTMINVDKPQFEGVAWLPPNGEYTRNER